MNAPVDVSFFARAAKPITSYRKYWAQRFGTAPFLPTTRAEMDELGWDSCDVILVTGDAYVDHPSFGMALVGRLLEAQGFRVGIIAQPDWQQRRAVPRARPAEPVLAASPPATWTRWSTATRRTGKIRRDDAYTPGGAGGKRPDRAVDRLRAALPRGVRRRADRASAASRRACAASRTTTTGRTRCAARSWSTRKRRPAASTATPSARSSRSRTGSPRASRSHEITRPARHRVHRAAAGCRRGLDRDRFDARRRAGPRRRRTPIRTRWRRQARGAARRDDAGGAAPAPSAIAADARSARPRARDRAQHRRPPADFEQVKADPVLYAHASRVLHLETNPGNARALVQRARRPRRLAQPAADAADHGRDGRASTSCRTRARRTRRYGDAQDPGLRDDPLLGRRSCAAASAAAPSARSPSTRAASSRAAREASILREIEQIRDKTPGLHRRHLRPRRPDREHVPPRPARTRRSRRRAASRRACTPTSARTSAPTTASLIQLYRKARALPGHQEDAGRVGRALRPGGARRPST